MGKNIFFNLDEVIYGRTLRNESNRAIRQNKRFKKILLSVPWNVKYSFFAPLVCEIRENKDSVSVSLFCEQLLKADWKTSLPYSNWLLQKMIILFI